MCVCVIVYVSPCVRIGVCVAVPFVEAVRGLFVMLNVCRVDCVQILIHVHVCACASERKIIQRGTQPPMG